MYMYIGIQQTGLQVATDQGVLPLGAMLSGSLVIVTMETMDHCLWPEGGAVHNEGFNLKLVK